MPEIDPENVKFQQVPSWQIGVDPDDAVDRGYLTLDDSSLQSLRDFIDSLQVPKITIQTELQSLFDLRYLTDVDVAVDGVDGIGNPSGDPRTLSLAVTLDSVREVEQLTADDDTGSVALVDASGGAGTGKKIQVKYPQVPEAADLTGTPELVLLIETSAPLAPASIGNGVNTVITGATASYEATAFTGAWSSVNGEFTVPAGEGGVYLVVATMTVDDPDGVAPSPIDFSVVNVDGPADWRNQQGFSTLTDESGKGGATITRALSLAAGESVSAILFHETAVVTITPALMSMSIFKIRSVV